MKSSSLFGSSGRPPKLPRIRARCASSSTTVPNLRSSRTARLDRLAEAQSTLRLAFERKVEIPEFLAWRYQIAFLKDDQAEMARLAARLEEIFGVADWIFGQEASVLAYYGHLQQARSKSRRAVDRARQARHPESAAQHEAGAAVREILFGHVPESRQSALSAHNLSNNRDAD